MLDTIKMMKVVTKNNCDAFTVGKSSVGEKDFLRAVKYFRTLGINVLDKDKTAVKRKTVLTIIVDDSVKRPAMINPFEVVVSKNDLIKLHKTIKRVGGYSLSLIIRAYSDALMSLDDDSLNALKKHTFEELCDHIEKILKSCGFPEGFTVDNHRACKRVLKFLGGYESLKNLIVDTLAYILFAEVTDKIPSAENKCYTCKHCKYDEEGNRYCSRGSILVDDTLNVHEVSLFYHEVWIDDEYNVMYSKYTPFGVYDCDDYRCRRMPKVKVKKVKATKAK